MCLEIVSVRQFAVSDRKLTTPGMSDKVETVPAAPATALNTGKPLPPPFRVSPTIKFCRWTLLIAGIFYGASRKRRLAAREIVIREEERRKKAIRDAEIAEYRRQASERDIAALAKMFK